MILEVSAMSILGKMGILGQGIALLIFGLSIIAVFVFIERFIYLSISGRPSTNFLNKIRELLSTGNVIAAKEYCQRDNKAISRVIAKGLNRIGHPMRDIEMTMDKQIDLEVFKYEKGEGFLSLVSKLAPMLGFIGTIGGVITIFYDINTTGNYNIETISGGLYVKMITSALGLTLGIVAFFLYFIINGKIKSAIFNLEKGASELIDILTTPSK